MNNSDKTVIVGMSGGVDSSVAAALLKEQGYRVIGLFMKNWDEKDENGDCPAEADYKDVIAVCERIDIPYYSIDFVKEYWDNVFSDFLEEFKKGFTPNPDILCNREIKFKVFLEKALELGADYLATGHYCKVEHREGKSRLLKGDDPKKDQSYFLHAVDGASLNKVLFPLGDIHKTKVRELAQKYDLATKEKKDSTGICFIGERNFSEFMQNYVAIKPGKMMTLAGKEMGEHQGSAFYTLGQRKGLGIGASKESSGEPWFVVDKNPEQNIVYVEQGITHPALYCDELSAADIHWIADVPELPKKLTAKIRYRQQDQTCCLKKSSDGYHVHFDVPQRAVTLGQYVVFYDENICLGGGVITSRGPSYYEQKRELPDSVTNI